MNTQCLHGKKVGSVNLYIHTPFFKLTDMINWPSKIFITGTDTDAGKSYATGWLAKHLNESGTKTITQKFVQTGCTDSSEDIDTHRRIMGIPYQSVDRLRITAPVIFTYPASPDLAAKIDGRKLDFNLIDEATEVLLKQYDTVIIEGAGGIMVPLKGDYLTLDYVRERKLPVAVVTNSRLGSINHTLLTLSALAHAGVEIFAVIYNPYFDKDKIIAEDSRNYIKEWLQNHYPDTVFLEMPERV